MEVLVEKIKPGSEVLGEIKDGTGRVVVKPGTKLTPLLIKRLVSWGVKSIQIMGEEPQDSQPLAQAAPVKEDKKDVSNLDKELVLRIAKKFSNVREDPLMDKIMRLSIKHLSNRQNKT